MNHCTAELEKQEGASADDAVLQGAYELADSFRKVMECINSAEQKQQSLKARYVLRPSCMQVENEGRKSCKVL